MTTTTTAHTDHTTVSAGAVLAAALCPYDEDRARAALHPQCRTQIGTPRGLEDHPDAEDMLRHWSGWFRLYETHRSLGIAVTPFADIARIDMRFGLTGPEGEQVMEIVLYVNGCTDGRVSVLTGVCSTPRPA